MKTDIEIAQEAVMEPIKNVAARCGISEDDLELYGKYKAKISDEYINSVKDNKDGKKKRTAQAYGITEDPTRIFDFAEATIS